MTDLRTQILAAEDIPHEDVPVPEWKGITVRVRGLTGTDRDAYEAKMVAMKKGGKDVELRLADYRSKLLVKCLVNPGTDQRIFNDGDAPALGRKAAVVIERLFDIATRLSGLGDDAVEDSRGNSGTVPSDGSTTD